MFDNRVLRIIFGPKRKNIIGELRKLHVEELHNFLSSLNVAVLILSSRIEVARHVVHMGETRRHVTKYLLENVKGRDHLENIDIKRRTVLKLILGSWL
jgi:hypothetical protein